MTDSCTVEVDVHTIDKPRPYDSRRLAYAKTKSPLFERHNTSKNKPSQKLETSPLLMKMTHLGDEIDKEEKKTAELAPDDEEVEESC